MKALWLLPPGIAAPHVRGRFEMGIGGSVEQSIAPAPADTEAVPHTRDRAPSCLVRASA